MQGTDSIREIKGIGEKSEKLFSKLGITTVDELLHFYPREYDVYTSIVPISTVREGDLAIIEGCFTGKPHIIRKKNSKGLLLL